MKTQELKVLAWNLADGLGDPNRAETLAAAIAGADPDIAVFSEGARSGIPVHAAARSLLEKNVGHVYEVDYDDTDGRSDTHRLVAVAKPKFGEPSVLPANGRNGFVFVHAKLPVVVAGLHGLDRDQQNVLHSDEARMEQMRQTLGYLALGLHTQALVMGDLNSMHHDTNRARLIRTGAIIANRLPAKNPGELQSRIERAGSLSQRLGQMALGGPIEMLRGAGFRDSNPHHEPTMYMGPLGVQLDHVMGRRVELFGHGLIDPQGLSDHYGVVSRVNVYMRKKHHR